MVFPASDVEDPGVKAGAPSIRSYGKPRPRKTAPSGWLVGGVVLGLLLAVLALLMVLGILPPPSSSATGGSSQPAVAGGEASPAGGQAAAPPPSYFLSLGSYPEGAIAALQARSLGQSRPDLLFVVAPVEVNGEILHRLLAGVTEDPSGAGLRTSLGRTLSQEDPTEWVVRPGPLSFHLGTFSTLEEATARAEELQSLQIHAYLSRATGLDAASFDVWAGAYGDSVEAGYLGRTLTASGIVPILARRSGEPVPE
jgi:hypothetical protein